MIVAVTALHYGADYLAHAIRSIIDDVDSYVVLYTPIGSHGHRTSELCPDTRDDLLDIAYHAAGDKLRWFEGVWAYEGQQRDAIYDIVPEADVIVTLDADEIWVPGLLQDAIAHGRHENARQVLIPLRHYWRSFYKGFTHDPAAPTRLVFPQVSGGVTTFSDSDTRYRIHHFGYAQNAAITRYKLLTHGHKNELRRDCDWFTDVFLPNRQTDCHPVGSEYWMQTEDLVPPDCMMDHPFAKLEVIE